MEQVHQLALGETDAGVEIPHAADVLALPVVFDPVAGDLLDELPDVDVGACVVDDCDLHLRTTPVLGEDRTQSVRHERPGVEDGDHHRPRS